MNLQKVNINIAYIISPINAKLVIVMYENGSEAKSELIPFTQYAKKVITFETASHINWGANMHTPANRKHKNIRIGIMLTTIRFVIGLTRDTPPKKCTTKGRVVRVTHKLTTIDSITHLNFVSVIFLIIPAATSIPTVAENDRQNDALQ